MCIENYIDVLTDKWKRNQELKEMTMLMLLWIWESEDDIKGEEYDSLWMRKEFEWINWLPNEYDSLPWNALILICTSNATHICRLLLEITSYM